MDAGFAEAMIALLPNLRRYALSLTRRGDQADDLVQQTVERAIANAASFDRAQRLEPWLFRIMRNAFIDQTRRQRREGTKIDIHEIPEVLPTDPGPGLEARLMLQSVEAAMADLPPDQREILHLVCVEEMSYAETARILDIPMGTVMSRLSRARLALSERLGIR
ncbi:RNA polymerase sigma factor [Paracoccus sp. PS-1]|uniref:RNA polymerase sigma factor n=1 Tax=unclassified Paracoccus (in: a-proteobacteria) TaxID=2688777 RepID=UPI000491B95D|nr:MULTISPECIES: RNA polymerase sigma factor [unclassified Paracoccus (in: a-proteobacteria)]MDQ7262623.1 RNA polymerase sigma factor [Paracoccus sp. PS1]UFM66542.1 RNA polymerase sigma factor [Paracoccus sp. MA]